MQISITPRSLSTLHSPERPLEGDVRSPGDPCCRSDEPFWADEMALEGKHHCLPQ